MNPMVEGVSTGLATFVEDQYPAYEIPSQRDDTLVVKVLGVSKNPWIVGNIHITPGSVEQTKEVLQFFDSLDRRFLGCPIVIMGIGTWPCPKCKRQLQNWEVSSRFWGHLDHHSQDTQRVQDGMHWTTW